MSSKWSNSRLSQSSSGSDGEVEASRKLSANSSDEEGSRKSRSRNKSGSGSDSGTARSKSSSNSGSRSRSGSAKSGSNRGNSSDSGTGGSRHSSPDKGSGREGSKSDSGSSSGSGSPAAKRRRADSDAGSQGSEAGSSRGDKKSGDKIYSSSDSSSQNSDSSSRSNKEKKLKKGKDHKASNKLEKRLARPDSEDEDGDSGGRRKTKKKSQKSKEQSSEEEEGTWRDEFDDGLDDELIGGEEDRMMLESLTEREREQEFYKRAEKREELKKRFEISQKLKKQQKQRGGLSSDGEIRDDVSVGRGMELGGGESSRASSSLADKFPVDPSSRKKGYEEKYGSKFSALSELKAKRVEKERKEKLREEKMQKNSKKGAAASDSESGGSDYEKLGRSKKNKNVLKASEIYSSSSSDEGGDVRRKTSSSSSNSSSQSDGESDTERQNSKKTVKKAINIETLDQLEKIRLSRFKLDKFVHLPIFKKTVIGCFVRVGIGKSPDGRDVYRCCEIVDTCETGKIYNVMKTKTNMGLKLRHGKDTRIFRLQFISNNPLSEKEFNMWKRACTEGNTNLPTISHVEQKQKDIKYALEYRFSTSDVEKILASKKKFDSTPKNYAMQKAELTKKRDMATHTGDLDKVDEYNKELDSLERRAEELDSQRTSTISSISFINDRNRKNNITRAYMGIHAEEKRKRIEGEVDDPFTRRKTKPKLGNTKAKNVQPEMTSELLKKLEDERKEKEKKAVKSVDINPILPPPVDFTVRSTGRKSDQGRQPKVDIFDAHDFEVDINVDEIPSAPVTPSISLKPVTASSAPAGPSKRSLKLEEWKKKRGII